MSSLSANISGLPHPQAIPRPCKIPKSFIDDLPELFRQTAYNLAEKGDLVIDNPEQ